MDETKYIPDDVKGFEGLLDSVISGNSDPILTVNNVGEVCIIPVWVLRGVFAYAARMAGDSRDQRTRRAQHIFDAICDEADPPSDEEFGAE